MRGERGGPIRLLAISDRRAPGGELPTWLEAMADAGVDAIQLREKDLSDRALFELARSAARRLAGCRSLLLVNGRSDVAVAAGAAGVHLPADEVSTQLVRHLVGPDSVVGRSTHRLEEVERAAREGADYVTFGPVFATPSKERYGPPRGLEALARAVSVGIPVLALGGIVPLRFEELAAAGAAGAAGIGMFRAPAAELEEAVGSARELFSGA